MEQAAFIDAVFWGCISLVFIVLCSVLGSRLVERYTKARAEREKLLLYIAITSLGIASAMLFAFYKIVDAMGFFFLSVGEPIAGVFIAAAAAAFWLNRYWSTEKGTKTFLLDRLLWLWDKITTSVSMHIAAILYPEPGIMIFGYVPELHGCNSCNKNKISKMEGEARKDGAEKEEAEAQEKAEETQAPKDAGVPEEALV